MPLRMQIKKQDKKPADASELVCYKCPSCSMLTWRKRQSKGKVSCPFCCNGLPEYVTKIVPETMTVHNEKPEKTGKPLQHPVKRYDTKHQAEARNETSPFTIEFFMVQGTGFQCMAYRNGDGKWRGAFDNEELPGTVRVLG